jgi:hypothetical protein
MADDNNIALQQALLERARREKARRAQAQAQSGPGLLGSIYENVIGSGAADTPGEKAGELIKGLGSGAMRGITELVGLPGSAMQGIDYLTRRAGLIPEEYRSPVAEAMSGAGLRRGLEQVTGGASEYAAPGTAGKFAGTVGEFVGGGVGGKLKPLVAGGLASEAAGQMTEGTAAEPYARVAGGLAGPMVGQVAERAARRAVSPYGGAGEERLRLADVLSQYDIPVTAGQRTGSDVLRRAEGATPAGEAISERQREAFTRAVLGTAGVQANRATGDVLNEAAQNIGRQFDSITAGVSVVPDSTTLTNMSRALEQYRQIAPSGSVPPLFKDVNKEVVRSFRSGNSIPAERLKQWRSAFSKLTKSENAATRSAAVGVMDVLDDAIARGLTAVGRPEDVSRLSQLREQYRNLMAVEGAAAMRGAEEGLLSPAQIRSAVARQSRRQYVRDQRGDIGELARAGSDILSPLPSAPAGGQRFLPEVKRASQIAAGTYLGGPVGGVAAYLAPQAAGALRMTDPMQRYLANQLVSPAQPLTSADFLRTIPGLLAQ